MKDDHLSCRVLKFTASKTPSRLLKYGAQELKSTMVLDTILHRVFQLVLSVNLNTILIISIAYALYWMVSGRYNYFRGSGITGPPTVPFFGNLWDFMDEGFQLHRVIDRYYLKYGKVFGFYYCAQPVIVVGDEDIAKEILGRKCSNFKNRKVRIFTSLYTDILCHSVTVTVPSYYLALFPKTICFE